jgi:LacI family transcriptional regulator
MMQKVKISQQQIAKDLGVSQTLVSMVLNGRRKGVSDESYKKILDHARKSGYRPKGLATEFLALPALSRSVGFILRAGATLYSESPFFGHVQHGLHDCLVENGSSLVFMGIENDLDARRLESLRNPEAFLGLVVLGEVSRSFLQAILKLHSRVVSVSAQYSGLCDSVVPNEEQAADLMVQHLLDLGHRRFAWLGGNKGTQRTRNRYRAIESALHLRGMTLDAKFCLDANSGDRREGSQLAEALLKAGEKEGAPTAWICFNAVMARGAITYLMYSGYKVPEDFSVVAFDATRVCKDEHPTLTAASTSPELMGRMAAERLLESEKFKRAAPSFIDTVIPAELVIGESTAAAKEKPAKAVKPSSRKKN